MTIAMPIVGCLPVAAIVLARWAEIIGTHPIQRALGIDRSPVLAPLDVTVIGPMVPLPITRGHPASPGAEAVFTTDPALGIPIADAISISVLLAAPMPMTALGIAAVELISSADPFRARPTP